MRKWKYLIDYSPEWTESISKLLAQIIILLSISAFENIPCLIFVAVLLSTISLSKALTGKANWKLVYCNLMYSAIWFLYTLVCGMLAYSLFKIFFVVIAAIVIGIYFGYFHKEAFGLRYELKKSLIKEQPGFVTSLFKGTECFNEIGLLNIAIPVYFIQEVMSGKKEIGIGLLTAFLFAATTLFIIPTYFSTPCAIIFGKLSSYLYWTIFKKIQK